MSKTKKEITNWMKLFYKKNNKLPTANDIVGFCGSTTVIRRFGSWTKALKTAKLPPRHPTIICKCVNCKKKFNKRRGGKDKNLFCSASCSTTYNNKLRDWNPNDKPPKFCNDCGKKLKIRQRKYCKLCYNNHLNDWSKITLKDLHKYGTYKKHRYIREHTRRTYMNSNLPKFCVWCDYDRHFDVCHIKPVNEFTLNTPISKVNSLSNLIALCKNHHWEFDNGYINKIELKQKLKDELVHHSRQK